MFQGISLSELTNQNMILPSFSCDVRKSLNQYLARQEITFNNTMEVGRNDLILALVKKGVGLTILPEMTVNAFIDQFYQITVPHGYLCIADLDPDGGLFHGNNEGVFHFGFNRDTMRRTLKEAGFDNIEFRTAAEIVRFIPGGMRPFTIFLVTGRKLG